MLALDSCSVEGQGRPKGWPCLTRGPWGGLDRHCLLAALPGPCWGLVGGLRLGRGPQAVPVEVTGRQRWVGAWTSSPLGGWQEVTVSRVGQRGLKTEGSNNVSNFPM